MAAKKDNSEKPDGGLEKRDAGAVFVNRRNAQTSTQNAIAVALSACSRFRFATFDFQTKNTIFTRNSNVKRSGFSAIII